MLNPRVRTAASLLICLLATSCAPKAPSSLTTEQQWMVGAIGKDIAEIVLFSAQKEHPEIALDSIEMKTDDLKQDTYQYSLSWNTKDSAVLKTKLSAYFWSPSNYVAWVNLLVKQLGTKLSNEAEEKPGELIHKLAEFDPQSIAETNKDLGARLSKTPLDAGANEEAALLCALYALRETATCFTDLRPWLNQIAAHLAIAEASRDEKPMGEAGKLSEVILLCLAGRPAESMTKIAEIEKQADIDNDLTTWLRALKIRATGDFRLMDEAHASTLEKLEYGRALSMNLSDDALTDYLEKSKPKTLPIDWMRIGMRGLSSVESGHTYCDHSVSGELGDAAADLNFYKGVKAKDIAEITATLREEAGGSLEKDSGVWHLIPISWNSLSAFHQRHLLDAVFQTYYFYQKMWSVPDEAKTLLEHSDKSFSTLPLYPALQFDVAFEKDENNIPPSTISQLDRLVKETPQLVTFSIWNRAIHHHGVEAMHSADDWFGSQFPLNTVFDSDNRGHHLYELASMSTMEEYKTLSPFDRVLLWNYASKKYPDGISGDHLITIYGPLRDYNLRAMNNITEAYWEKDEAKYAQELEHACKFQPNRFWSLGQYYEGRNDQKAVAAFENALKLGRDDVQFANQCGWLVNYYYTHGKKDMAEQLANKAGEVYSHSGLSTQAQLLERMGKITEAEKVYEAIKERYESPEDLCAFYMRNASVNSKYKEEGDKYLKKAYPDGLVKYDGKQDTAPKQGVLIISVSYATAYLKIAKNDIIVATNGYKVSTKDQYYVVRALNLDPKMEFVIWSRARAKYYTVTADLPSHKLGCDIKDYKPFDKNAPIE